MRIRSLALLLTGALAISSLSAQTKTTKATATAPAATAEPAKPPFQLFALPYATDALAPVISQRTVKLHYGKHVIGYLDKLNKLVRENDIKERDLVRLVRFSSGAIFDNAGQLLNHLLYFKQFRPYEAGRITEPQGALRAALLRSYKDFDAFKADFEKAGGEIFGSGWLWLSTDEAGDIYVEKTSNAGTPVTRGRVPLIAIDIWEHAYYLDYENRRADHLRAIWQIIDWEVVGRRYEARAKGVQL